RAGAETVRRLAAAGVRPRVGGAVRKPAAGHSPAAGSCGAFVDGFARTAVATAPVRERRVVAAADPRWPVLPACAWSAAQGAIQAGSLSVPWDHRPFGHDRPNGDSS